jgi:hypothetical protein
LENGFLGRPTLTLQLQGTIPKLRSWPGSRLEKTGAQIETHGRHGERGHQPDTAKQGDQCEGMGIGLSLRSFTLKNVGDKRIHGNLLIEIAITLLLYRFSSFSRGQKTASPEPVVIRGNLRAI